MSFSSMIYLIKKYLQYLSRFARLYFYQDDASAVAFTRIDSSRRSLRHLSTNLRFSQSNCVEIVMRTIVSG
jgi:hypothetical protein